MKKIIAMLLLALSILACGLGQSTQLTATQTALASTAAAVSNLATQAAWTATPTATPAIDYTAHIGANGIELFTGPGENYPNKFAYYDTVTIIGQAYNCTWFKVVPVSAPLDIGWANAVNISYTVNCADVKAADFLPPPAPTDTPRPIPTATPTQKPAAVAPAPAPVVSCQINSNIILSNRSTDPVTTVLTGPGTFTFTVPAGAYETVKVCSGTYNYTVYGTCNGQSVSGSGRISDGDQVYWKCN